MEEKKLTIEEARKNFWDYWNKYYNHNYNKNVTSEQQSTAHDMLNVAIHYMNKINEVNERDIRFLIKKIERGLKDNQFKNWLIYQLEKMIE